MGGHYFIRDNEIHYEMAASKDKDFVVIEGATSRQPEVGPEAVYLAQKAMCRSGTPLISYEK